MAKHRPDNQVFSVEIPGIETARPSDLSALTTAFALSPEGVWLNENGVNYDLAMSGLDFIGDAYLIIFDKNDAMRFKLTFA